MLELGELLFEQVIKEVKAQLHCSDVLSQEVNEVSRVQQVDETLEAVELFEFEGEEDHGYDSLGSSSCRTCTSSIFLISAVLSGMCFIGLDFC